MDRYAATGLQTCTATPGDTALGVEGDATTRAKILDIVFSHSAVPADTVIQWLVRVATALGTSTAVTPQPLDTDAPAALLAGAENHTVEPTYAAGSEIMDFDLNQRASFRWVAAPGSEIWVPASATAAVGVTPISAAYTGDVRTTAIWEE